MTCGVTCSLGAKEPLPQRSKTLLRTIASRRTFEVRRKPLASRQGADGLDVSARLILGANSPDRLIVLVVAAR
jgi:hypothetical protein